MSDCGASGILIGDVAEAAVPSIEWPKPGPGVSDDRSKCRSTILEKAAARAATRCPCCDGANSPHSSRPSVTCARMVAPMTKASVHCAVAGCDRPRRRDPRGFLAGRYMLADETRPGRCRIGHIMPPAPQSPGRAAIPRFAQSGFKRTRSRSSVWTLKSQIGSAEI